MSTLSTIITILVILFILVAVFGAFFIYVYWWLVQRPVPQIDGELKFSCLDSPVEVLRDRHGVPHIYAQNRADLFRAQGIVHAQDRLWQMEQNRRIARGTLSELFGKAALDVDRFSRIVGFHRSAQLELETLDDETLQHLTWFCEGVNEYMRQRPGRLAAEFNLLRRQPEPWTPVDILAFAKVMGWSLSINWESELVRVQLLEHADAFRAAELEPEYPEYNPVITEGVGSQDSVRMLSTAGLLLGEYEKLKEWLGPQGARLGSNSWAVAPKHTTTARAILCNDPHLPLTIPGVWYENHLECPDFQVSGVSFPGTPGIIIGHNRHMAWGLTNAFPDVQDLYIERPHPDDPHLFEYNGEWEPAQVLREEIYVRNNPNPHVEEVVITRHGPIISRLVEGGTPHTLALRWIGHEPGGTVTALLRMNQATNWDEFDEALAEWSVPAQNVTYADVYGNIAYRMAGKVPIRANGLGLVPAPGWTDEYEWTGVIPHQELPHLYNPESGYIVTANNKLTGDDYPYFLGAEYFPGWRARRIEEMLRQKKRLNSQDMEVMQMDTTSLYAESLAPLLTRLQSSDPWEKAALNMLRDWSFRMEPESPAALIFHYVLLHLLDMTFGDKLGPARSGYFGEALSPLFIINGFMHRAETRLLEILTEHEESIWYTDAATGRPRTRDELLQEAFSLSVKRIRKEVNANPRRWAWGRMHQVRYAHPLGSVRILSGFFNRGPFPVGGDGTTPNQTSYQPKLPPGLVQVVASYRQICDVGDWDATITVTTSGQSGHPFSRNYVDQIPMWLEGVYHAMPWTRPAVEQISKHKLVLAPEQQPPT